MDAKQVYDYAAKYAAKAESEGRGTQWPTLKQAARRFRRKMGDILECVESADARDVGGEYFGIAVGFSTGRGFGSFDREADFQIEAY